MSEQLLNSPGFYGKLPLSGDFVSRGQDPEFVRFLDPWLAKHIAPRIHEDALWPNQGLRFMLAPGIAGEQARAGVILPSHDRTGRWFPLVGSSVAQEVSMVWGEAADEWFAGLAQNCEAASQGEISADELEQAIAQTPPPMEGAIDLAEGDMFLWCAGAQPILCDPNAPERLLDALILIDTTGEVEDD